MTVTRACGGTPKSTVRKTVGGRAAEQQSSERAEESQARQASHLAVVRELIKSFMSDIRSGNNVKGTVGDLLRLMQIEKELAPPEDHEVVVRWVDPEE